jgi:nitrite reductase/ring-hydroxylating ferredoxin subunit
MLARAYGNEREVEQFSPLVPVDRADMERLALQVFEDRIGRPAIEFREIKIGAAADIPVGERRIVNLDGALSLGIFHLDSGWYAIKNSCQHRGGPVATGELDGTTITCPWHGFQYDVTNGELLVDRHAKLETYPVIEQGDDVFVRVPFTVAPVPVAEPVPVLAEEPPAAPAPAAPSQTASQSLKPNEFRTADLAASVCNTVDVNGTEVAVFNVNGAFVAVQNECTHAGGPLCEGTLEGNIVTCPIHRARFDVITGAVVKGPAKRPLQTFQVKIEGDIGSAS